VQDYSRLVSDFSEAKEAFSAQATIADIYHHRMMNLPQAAAEYQKLVTKFPDRADAARYQLVLADLYFELKNYEQASHEAQNLVDKWPKAPEVPRARFDIANAAYLQNQVPVALGAYEVLVKDFPTDSVVPLAEFEMANCYQEMGENNRALDLLYQALKTHPHPQVVQRKIARIRRRLQQSSPNAGIYAPRPVADVMPKKKGKKSNTTVVSDGPVPVAAEPAAEKDDGGE
jgi:tetratricopeptide (TPR) repeat protein